MARGPLLLASLAFAAVLMGGCGASEAAAVEPAKSTEQANQAASSWSPEMKEKFKQAHERARSGQDGTSPAGGK